MFVLYSWERRWRLMGGGVIGTGAEFEGLRREMVR